MAQLTALLSGASDVLVITLGARRPNGEHITDAQKDAAMNAAKSVLQIIGAEVEANSTAILESLESQENQSVVVKTDVSCEVVSNNVEAN